MRLIYSLIFFCCLISGCREEEQKKEPVQKIPENFYDIKELPKPVIEEVREPEPEPEEEPVEVAQVDFPDTKSLIHEQKARHLRGERLYRNRMHRNRIYHQQNENTVKENNELRLEDPDYQQWEDASFDEDKSTLPVDRSRILTADMRIPAITEDAVNSQIPGRLIAIIDKDILSPNGKKILLPAYSKVICHYEGLGDVNATRLPVQCKRIIRPDGLSVRLTDVQSSDQAGRSGLIGDIDHRTLERYGAAFTVSLISALAQMSSSLTKQEAYANATNQFSNNLGQVTAKVLEQKIDLTPILTIPQGTRIQIIPENDIVFRKPEKYTSKRKTKQKETKTSNRKKPPPASNKRIFP